jgi:hypothetical protein
VYSGRRAIRSDSAGRIGRRTPAACRGLDAM